MPPLRTATPPRCLFSHAPLPHHHGHGHGHRLIAATAAASTTTTNTTITTTRPFSSTPLLPRQRPSHYTVPADLVPDYPFGRFTTYKQRNEGLFGRSKKRFGNTVAAKWGRKSPTSWLPNQHTRRLWSPSLQGFIRTRVTTSVLKTIDLLGGIDEYLLGNKTKRIRELGPAGWALRWKIMQTPAVQERFARERAAMGLPPKVVDPQPPPPLLPAELQAGGATAESVMGEVDRMLERDEEFVIGEARSEEEMVVKAGRETIGEVEPTPDPTPTNDILVEERDVKTDEKRI